MYSNPFVEDGKGEIIFTVTPMSIRYSESSESKFGENYGEYFGYSICVTNHPNSFHYVKCI